MAGPEVPEQVRAGAAFLDEVIGPGWIEQVNLDTLDIESGCKCVAAQLVSEFEGGYNNAWEYAMYAWGVTTPDDLDEGITTIDCDRARELGFLAPQHSGILPSALVLENGWRDLIAARIIARAAA
jgi:hypothetical protein